MKELITQFCTSLSNYALLKRKNAEMKGNHSMSQPIRNISDSASYSSIEAAVCPL